MIISTAPNLAECSVFILYYVEYKNLVQVLLYLRAEDRHGHASVYSEVS